MEEKEWFLYVVDRHEGPFSAGEVKKKVKEGQAKDSSFVWKEGFSDWVMMTDTTEFGNGSQRSDGHGPITFATERVVASSAVSSNTPDLEGISPSASVWCLNSRKVFSGPHSMKTIVRKVNDGDVSVQDSIWKEGWNAFVPISNIPEFMQQVKPDMMQDGKKSKKNNKGSIAAAIGIGGARPLSYRWYKSTKFMLFMALLCIVAAYQAISQGSLDPLLAKASPSTLATLKSLDLKPIAFENGIESVSTALENLRRVGTPIFASISAKLPEPVRGWVSPVQIPEGVAPQDAEALREVALSELRSGLRVASALPVGDEMNPRFVIASNAPDGTMLRVTLKGKEGTLLNAFSYEKSVDVTVSKHLAQTRQFSLEGTKPVPRGEYILSVQELKKGEQGDESASKRRALAMNNYFLGGKKDAAYSSRLQEYNDRVKARLDQEISELRQAVLTLENIANESATKYTALIRTPANARRKAAWSQYDTAYQKISKQLYSLVNSAPATAADERVLAPLYEKLRQTYQLTESLHQVETDVIEGRETHSSVEALAGKTTSALDELKQGIFKHVK